MSVAPDTDRYSARPLLPRLAGDGDPLAGRDVSRPAAAGTQRAAGHRARLRRCLAARLQTGCASWWATWFPAVPLRWPRPTPATSSAATCRGWAMAAPCCWASSSTPTGASATSISKVPAPHRSPAGVTASRRWDRCCASTSSARPCTLWVFRRRDLWLWSRRDGRCSARRFCRAPCSPASPAATCASGAFNTPRPPPTWTCCDAWPIMRSPVTIPSAADAGDPYLALFEAVAAVQASLVARWMLIGFIHGVMNTDNMTISGETIDYGPCAFMEAYDPDTVFSSIDYWGRYAYDNQPAIAGWNLARFAEALLPLLSDNVEEAIALAENSFGVFRDEYATTWTSGMRAKLGLPADVDAATVTSLVDELLRLLKESQVDYTSFFRQLSEAARGATPGCSSTGRLRRVDLTLASARPGRRVDGPHQPDLHSAQPSRRGGADRGDGRRPGSAPAAARCRDRPLRRATGLRALRQLRRPKTSAPTEPSAAPELSKRRLAWAPSSTCSLCELRCPAILPAQTSSATPAAAPRARPDTATSAYGWWPP